MQSPSQITPVSPRKRKRKNKKHPLLRVVWNCGNFYDYIIKKKFRKIIFSCSCFDKNMYLVKIIVIIIVV
jgi:hypothetical protein